jgi:hypothetical protein
MGLGPEPVGPWGPYVERLSPGTRDMLIALATHEPNGLTVDAKSRSSLQTAARQMMGRALKEFR